MRIRTIVDAIAVTTSAIASPAGRPAVLGVTAEGIVAIVVRTRSVAASSTGVGRRLLLESRVVASLVPLVSRVVAASTI